MIIKVRSDEIKLWLPIPITWVFSDLTALFVPKILEQNGVTMSQKQVRKLMRATRKCIRRHRGLTLVEAETTSGEYVEIKL